MPTLPPGTEVLIRPEVVDRLTFPPWDASVIFVAVHEAGLQAQQSLHTQLLGFTEGYLSWAGALSEAHLEVVSEGGGDPRMLLGESIGAGPRMWDVIWPGELVRDPRRGPLGTTYQGERPWVVIGETNEGDLLASPLNEAGNPKWYTPLLAQEEIQMPGSSKDAQLELAHLWSFPSSLPPVGSIAPLAQDRVFEELRKYY